ncbi:MAG: hypothetical protein RLY16_713 [Bacteroidota bacterium]|jgi:hypothetical protein
MASKFTQILLSAVLLTSCTTAYKSGQTPDDVYYSPTRAIGESTVKQERDPSEVWEEQQIRLQIRNQRWTLMDNDFCYNPYGNNYYGYSGYQNYQYPFFNNYYNYNALGYNYGNFYNPYTGHYALNYPVTVAPVRNSTPRFTSLAGYGNNYNNNNNSSSTKLTSVRPIRGYNNNNSSGRNNNSSREILNNNSSSSDNNTRSYTPSSSSGSSSSGSSSSGSSGSVSRPSRNGQ